MPRDENYMINPCAKFEVDTTCCSRFSATTMLHWLPVLSQFLGIWDKFHISNPQKALPWRERRIMTYWALGCVHKCDLWAWRRKKKNRNFHASNWLFAHTTHVDIGRWNFACWVVSGN